MMKYKFIIDCKDKKSCKKIRDIMKQEHYTDIKMTHGTLLGDHVGTKKFMTERGAKRASFNFFKRNSSMMYGITVE